jgi:hypothetical protein
MRQFFAFLIFALGGVASAHAVGKPEILCTTKYTLTIYLHCVEGEVGCSRLTGVLLNKSSGEKSKLTGSTHMVMCRDGVTPCHVGFDELRSRSITVRAYPDGTLEVDRSGSPSEKEQGSWDS